MVTMKLGGDSLSPTKCAATMNTTNKANKLPIILASHLITRKNMLFDLS